MPNNKINYTNKREQAMLAVINQLDLRDNDHGLKDVIDVLAEFWNTAVKLAESKDKSSILKRPRTTVLPVMIVESKDITAAAAAFEGMSREKYEAYIAKKATNQIFAELKKYATVYGDIVVPKGKYEAIQKKYGVD